LFDCTGIWTQCLTHARQALYYLSYAPSPFCLVVFKKMVSHLCLGSRGLQSFYLCFLHRLDDRHIPPYSAFIGWDGRSHEFLPGVASNCSSPNVHIPSG
jgi:hypothetical protein